MQPVPPPSYCDCADCYIAGLQGQLDFRVWQAGVLKDENTRLAREYVEIKAAYQAAIEQLYQAPLHPRPPLRLAVHETGCQAGWNTSTRDTQTDLLPPDPLIERLRKDLLSRGETNTELSRRIDQITKEKTTAETALGKLKAQVTQLNEALANAKSKIPPKLQRNNIGIQTTQEIPPQAISVVYLILAGLLSAFKIPPTLRPPNPELLLQDCKGDLYEFHNLLFQRTWEHLIFQSLSATQPLPSEQLACIAKLAKVIDRQFYPNAKKPSDPYRFLVENPAFTAELLRSNAASAPAEIVNKWSLMRMREHP